VSGFQLATLASTQTHAWLTPIYRNIFTLTSRLERIAGSGQSRLISKANKAVGLASIPFFLFAQAANALIVDRLDTSYYSNDANIDNATHRLNYTDMPGALDLLDSFDVLYSGFPSISPLNVSTKIVSIIPEGELETNVKTLDYTSALLELSLITRDGSPTQIPSGHYLDFSFVNTGYTNNFDNNPITLWRLV